MTMSKSQQKIDHNAKTVKHLEEGLPWWLSGKESTCQCRRHRFNPWSRKISHAVEQLNLGTTTSGLQSLGSATELLCHNSQSQGAQRPRLPNKKSHHHGKPGQHNWRIAPACRATKTQHSQKHTLDIIFLKKGKRNLKKKNLEENIGEKSWAG